MPADFSSQSNGSEGKNFAARVYGHTTWCKENGVSSQSFQLSEPSCVSMSTLQIGHFLLVASHWSTHTWWKRCMQGNRLRREKHRVVRTEEEQGTKKGQKSAVGATSNVGKHQGSDTSAAQVLQPPPPMAGQRWSPSWLKAF